MKSMESRELSRKLFLTILKLSSFMFIASLFIVAYTQEKKLDSYKVQNGSYDKNIEISYNDSTNTFKSDKKNNDVDNFIACYENPINQADFNEKLKSKLDELYTLFSDSNYILSFSYEDLYTGLHISYNENQEYFAASTIKAPVVLYVYEQADLGKLNLDSHMIYTSNFFVEGSGSLQYKDFGGTYTVRYLSEKAIVESDNIAYQMVSSSVDNNGIKNFWSSKGATTFWKSGVWCSGSAHDFVIYMKELYKYYLTDTKLSRELMEYFYNSVFPLIKSNNGSKVAHKSGWRGEIMHDSAIVFDQYPYVVAIFTNKGGADYKDFFANTSNLIAEFHQIYWESKSNYCYNQAFKK